MIEGTEFVPLLGDRERNRYYFWSPYPFYAMKRNDKNQAPATNTTKLRDHHFKCSLSISHQHERGNSGAMKHLSKLQEPITANQRASVVNNKTSATVSVEITNAQAIISPQNSGQREISSGVSAESSIFAGFSIIKDPLNVIKQTFFGNKRNRDSTQEVSKAPVLNMDNTLIPVI